jgi:hypothetical protein
MTSGSERGCGNERVAIADSSDRLELPLHRLSEIFNNLLMVIDKWRLK